ncbi:MAG: hypothetical protein ACLP9K_04330 [Nitrososphaerales archaeon]
MAIVPVEYYYGNVDVPSFFILVYNYPKPPVTSPNSADQILKAASWSEAQQFARAFLSITRLQYVVLSSLSPREPSGASYETNRETYWREGDRIILEPWRMGMETIKVLTERKGPVVAREEDPEMQQRLREITRMMNSARPGESLVDILNRRFEADLAKNARARTKTLWKYGNFDPEQGRLVPLKEVIIEAPRESARKGEQTDLGAYERDVPRGRDTIGGSKITEQAFVRWLQQMTAENFGALDLKSILANYADFGINAAKDRAVEDPLVAPWLSLESKQIEGLEENPLYTGLKETIEMAREAGVDDRQILTELKKMGFDLERPTSEGLQRAKREVEQLTKEKEELEKKLEEAKHPVIPGAKPPRPRTLPGPISPEEVSLLYNTFVSIITRRVKREPFPAEISKFDDLVDTLQKIKPPLKFVQARIQVENLAQQLATVASAGRIVVTRGKARMQELLETMLSRQLTPDEADELARLQAGEEFTTTEVIEYEKPTVYLVADSGPWKVAYPYRLGGYWRREDATVNMANWESKGFKVRIEGNSG